MESTKFSNLCSHYKDSFDNHRATIKQRDKLFYGLLVILAIFTLQLSSSATVTNVVNEYLNNTTGIKLGNNADFISTLLWFLLLGYSIRYFQIVIEINGQYDYLHLLEKELNTFYTDTKIFTREGVSYLSDYPLFSKWMHALYTVIFPLLIVFCIVVRVWAQILIIEYISINVIIDFICFVIILISSCLYIQKLHFE